MPLNVTMDTETINYNKGAEIKDNDGRLIGTLNYNVTNQQYAGVNFNINIANKEKFIASAEAFRADIIDFFDEFVAKTIELNTVDGSKSDTVITE